MKRVSKVAMLVGAAVLVGVGFAGAAYAQATANNAQAHAEGLELRDQGRQARPQGAIA